MGAIKSDFPSLAADDSETKAAEFAGVLSDLKGRKWPVPPATGKALTRGALLAHLQGIAGAVIFDELKADEKRPEKADAANPIPQLYANASDAEIASTFNAFRAGRLFVGLPCAPNAITAEDIAAAKKG